MRVLLEINDKKVWGRVDIDGEIHGSYINVFAIQSLYVEFEYDVWTDCNHMIEELETQICLNINDPEMRAA
jgi:hypothetical protein